jgi:hypothetical protein
MRPWVMPGIKVEERRGEERVDYTVSGVAGIVRVGVVGVFVSFLISVNFLNIIMRNVQ